MYSSFNMTNCLQPAYKVYVLVKFLLLHCVTWWIDITTKTSICPSRRQLTRTTPSCLTNRNILFTLLHSTSLDADSVRRDLILIGWTNRRQRSCCLWHLNCEWHSHFPFALPSFNDDLLLFNHDGQHNHFHWWPLPVTGHLSDTIPTLICTRSVITCQWI